MIKRRYLAIVSDNFDPEDLDFKASLMHCDMHLEGYFPELGVIKLSSSNQDQKTIEISEVPFIEYIEEESNMEIPPEELDMG